MSDSIYDYIIVGGGICGCTLASRLHSYSPSASILLIEAGPNVSSHPLTSSPLACFAAHFSDLDWAYFTVPQKHLDNRPCYAAGGKALSGGSATNYATWTRGAAVDYDRWAHLVGDESWNYQGLLPYFKKSETHYDEKGVSKEFHGFNGPIHSSSVSASSPNRKYPLRDQLKKAWEAIGVEENPDGNSGNPLGMAELVENWRDGKRQLTSESYDLSGVTIKTDTMVQKIVIENGVATGVELASGEKIKASKEVIISTGTYRTPQLLMLSGIGPEATLNQHSIPTVLTSPHVGQNFHDHLAVTQWFKLTPKYIEAGTAIGNPHWQDPSYTKGLPCDWNVSLHEPNALLEPAIEKDGQTSELKPEDLLSPSTVHTETILVYAPAGAQLANVHTIPMDGSHIGSAVLGMMPTSRGSITISSNKVTDPPVIDPNYYATESDRVAVRSGIRRATKLLLESKEMEGVVESETPPEGYAPLTSHSSDEEIDARVRRVANTFYHAAGSCRMGGSISEGVVDAHLRVFGVQGLRVCDASILPCPVAAHLQAIAYAIGVMGAAFIGEGEGK